MKVKNAVLPLALIASLFSGAVFAKSVNVTNLGDLNVTSPNTDNNLVQVGAFFLPDVFTFSLSQASNVDVTFSSLLGFGVGSTFSLYDSTGTTKLETYTIPTVTIAGSHDFSFSNLGVGSYEFKYNPGVLTVNVASSLTFTATPVPEPENSALMLAGLGLIGLIARRKFV